MKIKNLSGCRANFGILATSSSLLLVTVESEEEEKFNLRSAKSILSSRMWKICYFAHIHTLRDRLIQHQTSIKMKFSARAARLSLTTFYSATRYMECIQISCDCLASSVHNRPHTAPTELNRLETWHKLSFSRSLRRRAAKRPKGEGLSEWRMNGGKYWRSLKLNCFSNNVITLLS